MPKKEKVGQVVSTKMDKTVVVKVSELKPHPKYKKIMARTKKYLANDPEGICTEEDEVSIIESRPISKGKRWSVARVIKKKAT